MNSTPKVRLRIRWPRASWVKRWKVVAAAAKKNHMTRMSITITVADRTRYCGSSGWSGRMNCGMKARKKTIALGLSRLTHRPRRNMDKRRLVPQRGGLLLVQVRFVPELLDAQVDQVGGAGVADDVEGQRRARHQHPDAEGHDQDVHHQGGLLAQDAPDGAPEAGVQGVAHGVDGARAGREADQDAGAGEGQPKGELHLPSLRFLTGPAGSMTRPAPRSPGGRQSGQPWRRP